MSAATYRRTNVNNGDWRTLSAYRVIVDGEVIGTVRSHATSTTAAAWSTRTVRGVIVAASRREATAALLRDISETG